LDLSVGRPASHESRERGQTSTESAVLIGLLSIALVIAILLLRGTLAGGFVAGGTKASAPYRPPAASCDPNYGGGCVPPYPPDVDCNDLRALGIGEVTITGSDPHHLDPDGDGVGCN
jgi:Flp pilus assembly pilin Flp